MLAVRAGATRKGAKKSNHGVAPTATTPPRVAGRRPAVGRHHHPAEVLSQIGSPFTADPRPAVSEALDHAA